MRLKYIAIVLMCCFTASVMFPAASFADETSEAILRLLIKKGIISQSEVNEIKAEVAGTQPSVPTTVGERLAKLEKKSKKMSWAKRIKLKGDFRLRHQYDDIDDDTRSGRHRGRIRYRLGIEGKFNDKVKVLAGLASGGTDPRSTNQTFQDTFTTKGINLDYAYAKYTPKAWLTLLGGKMHRKPILWEPTDLLWDSDINPEGVAVLLTKKLGEVKLFMNNGFYVIDEASGASQEPWMVYTQPGFETKLFDDVVSLKGAVTVYRINTKMYAVNNPATKTNTQNNAGTLYRYDYDSISPAFELGINKPFGKFIPYAAIFGEYIEAWDADDNNSGYAVGMKFGNKKVKEPKQWQLKYIYRRLERDAFLDALPDADVYMGGTNLKSHEWIFYYGLAKNITFGLDIYYNEPISSITGIHTKENDQFIVQSDLVFKF